MVEKLSITIALEGGKELERQLADIGEAGQKAFLDIAKAAEKAGGFEKLKPEEVTAKLKQMGIVGTDAFKKIQDAVAGAARVERLVGGVQAVENGFAGLARSALALGRALGPIAAAAGVAFAAMVKGAADAAEAINKIDAAAIKAGMGIEQFDRLRQGFEKAGISAKGVEQAMLGVAQAADAAKLQGVTDAIKNLAAASNDAGTAMRARPADFRLLQQAAEGIGPAADKARAALGQFGAIQIPGAAWVQALGGTARTLQDFIRETGDAGRGTAAFVESLRQMPDSANRSALAIDAFKDAGAQLVQALRTGIITEDQFKQRLGTLGQEAANASNKFVQSVNLMLAAWERFKTTGDVSQLGVMWEAFASAALQAFSIVGEGLATLGGKIGELAKAVGGAIWDSFASAGQAAIDLVSGAISGLIGKLKELGNAIAGAFSGGGGTAGAQTPAPGFARGGPVGGRGSGTSDSNLAWVSRGEHVMPARAVAQPGVLAFLEALRRSGGNLSRVLDGMGRFAMGGPVGLPAFAAGGGVGSLSHVTIAFPGLPEISGLRASSAVVEQLQRAAAMAQVRSGGRKPSRYS